MTLQQSSRHSAAARPMQQPFTRVAPVLSAALLLGAGGGFLLAAILTVTRALRISTGAWWVALAQAHGRLQVIGWAGLFIVGVLLHFLPRLAHTPLARAGVIPWLLSAAVVGLLLRMVCQPLAAVSSAPLWSGGVLLSALLTCVGIVGLVSLVATVLWRSARAGVASALDNVALFIGGGCLGLLTALVVDVASAAHMRAGAGGGLIPPTQDALVVTLGIFGFLVPMALGMSARTLPMYAGLDAFPTRVAWAASSAYLAGVALWATAEGARGALGGWETVLGGAGMLLMGSSVLAMVSVFMRLMRTRGRLPRHVTQLAPSPERATAAYRKQIKKERAAFGPFVAHVASAYIWAIVGAVLLLGAGVAGLAGGESPAIVDAIRHSFAVGFIAMLLSGLAPRMLTGFSHGHIASPALVMATLWLGNGAAALRVGSALLVPLIAGSSALGELDALLLGVSGILGLAFAICLAVNLWPALWPGGSQAPAATAGAPLQP